ncbi:choice-of-anchor I family protein [Thalassotalea sp. LPB0316]|uniref:choice-of-anchor I family protein n=1 Tax=Thalassotalea sp. LPB0316 TaxID=2769490 RepID=UPI00186857AF|nr:choice-of-anchor I family protein [Thalassotalea sp. LPB0316]QOL25873.1 choice-of-anchor I family protein [Thalassotalea sp. LPB0316]
MKKTKIALMLSAALALGGCFADGNDGANGAAGPQGPQGEQGIPGDNAPVGIDISMIGRAVLNAEDAEGAAEIVSYQISKNWLYAINSSTASPTVNIIDLTDVDANELSADGDGVITNTNLATAITLDVSANTPGDANSIAVNNSFEVLAVAMAADETGTKGMVAFYDIAGAQPVFIKNVEVGYLPDALAFSPNGRKLVVANEGEPSGDYTIDPEGSISIIDLDENGVIADTASSITFEAFNNSQTELEAQGMKFTNPTGRTIKGQLLDITVAMDLEPEYVAISKDNKTAFVSLQENNGIAIVDLETHRVDIKGLGFKDWSVYGLDASDKDGGVNIRTYPNLKGLYQPDTVASFTWQGAAFVVTANEGDGREYFFDADDEASCLADGGLAFDEDDGCLSYIDEVRAEDLTLGTAFDGINNDDSDLGRLKVIEPMGDDDNDGIYESLYTYGARSFSIFDQNGNLVFDSGDDMERITASIHGASFNNDEDENQGDTRSDAKGPEPEALAIGEIGDKRYAFIGLERMGGVMVYDITNPYNVNFVDYFINRGLNEDQEITGDLAPEGMAFIHADNSPTDEALLIIGNEISGSVSIWQISQK